MNNGQNLWSKQYSQKELYIMVKGYCRVSSKGQLKEGYSLEVQTKEILDRYENAIIKQEQFTGTTTDRPIFNALVEGLQEGDTLVVTKLDRLARNTVEGIQIVQNLFDRGIAVHVLNVGLLENTTMGKFFLTTLLAVAEMERNSIVERTQSGKAIAKTKEGFREGRPKEYTQTQIDMALDLLEKHSYTQVEKMTKISKSTLVREMRKRKVKQALGQL
jgi:DNA invertase Pin-like site-specific DNA recombinase